MNAYIWAIVITAVLFLVAVVVSNLILFKPNGSDIRSRKVCFWVLCVLTPILSLVVNYIIAQGIKVSANQDAYILHTLISSGVAFVVFLGVGFGLSKIFSRSKIGTWF